MPCRHRECIPHSGRRRLLDRTAVYGEKAGVHRTGPLSEIIQPLPSRSRVACAPAPRCHQLLRKIWRRFSLAARFLHQLGRQIAASPLALRSAASVPGQRADVTTPCGFLTDASGRTAAYVNYGSALRPATVAPVGVLVMPVASSGG
jgi:hypothetical protein